MSASSDSSSSEYDSNESDSDGMRKEENDQDVLDEDMDGQNDFVAEAMSGFSLKKQTKSQI